MNPYADFCDGAPVGADSPYQGEMSRRDKRGRDRCPHRPVSVVYWLTSAFPPVPPPIRFLNSPSHPCCVRCAAAGWAGDFFMPRNDHKKLAPPWRKGSRTRDRRRERTRREGADSRCPPDRETREKSEEKLGSPAKQKRERPDEGTSLYDLYYIRFGIKWV